MQNIPFKVRMLIAFLAIFLVPLILIGIPGGIFITQNAQDKAVAEMEQMCAGARDAFADRLARMDTYMLQVSHDAMVVGIMNMQDKTTLYKRYPAIELSKFANQLRLMLITTEAFDDLALCFPKQDFALTQRGVYNLSQLFRYEFAVEGMDQEDWLSTIQAHGSAHHFISANALSTFGAQRPGLLYTGSQFEKYENNLQFAVVFFLSSSSLDQTFSPMMRYPGSTLSLATEDGTVLYSFTKQQDEKKQEALSTWSSRLGESGLTMQITVPRSMVMQTPNMVRNAVLLILALMGGLGGILSTFVARMNYRPLENIFTILFERGTLPEQHPSATSLKNVEQSLASLLDKDEFLQKQLDEYHDLLQYAALSRLLDGSLAMDAERQADTFDALGLPLPYRFLSVGVLYKEEAGAVERIGREGQALQFLAYPVEQDGRTVFLFNHATEDMPRQLVRAASVPVYMGISAPYVLLADVHRAYREALYAVNYRPVSTQGNAVFYVDVYDARSNYFYPEESEARLVNLLRAGDAQGAREAFDKLLAHNLQDDPAAYVLHRFLDSVAMTIFRQCGIGQSAWEQEHPPVSSSAPVDEMTQYTYALLDAAAEKGAVHEAEAPDAFLQGVMDYIDENLCNPQLSLGSVAEHAGVSASHLSRYIKKASGVGYLDLVNRKRVTMAKSLLRRGDLSIKNIAGSVGFDSDVTLRRLFKKYEGVAPTQYTWSNENK